MTTIEVMRKALEALTCSVEPDDPGHRCGHCDDYVDRNGPVRAALRAEIERLEAAPDAYAIPLAPPGVDDTLFELVFAENVPMPPDPRAYRLYAWPVAQAAVEPVAWRIRIGDSPDWSTCYSESDADFYGRQSCCRYVKEPLYTAPIAPAIPALAPDELSRQVPEALYTEDDRGAFMSGARWAYSLAAERAGVQIK